MRHSDAVEVEMGICVKCTKNEGPVTKWWEGKNTREGYLCFKCLIDVLTGSGNNFVQRPNFQRIPPMTYGEKSNEDQKSDIEGKGIKSPA